jgi:hypothetical protein
VSAPITAKPPRHPASGLVWAFVAIAAAFVAVAAWLLVMGNVIGGGGAIVISAFALWFGRMLGGQIVAVQRTNTAVQQLMRGDLAATTATLDAIPARAARSGGNVRRGIATLRAMVALYEGRLEESATFATSAIEGRRGFFTRVEEGPQIAAAHGVRALARAALGDAAGAKLDADAAETSVDATPEVIARARLVRAIVASRVVYHEEAFRAYLAANARLVLEHAMPRERALFRALRRMSRGPQRSVYREQGRKTDDQAPSKLASWIAFVAPEAAAFVEGDRMLAERADDDEIPSGVPSDVRAIRTARATAMPLARSAHRRRRVTIGVASLIAFVAIVWRALAPSPTGTPPVAEEPLGPSSWTYDAFVLLFPLVLATIAWTTIMALRARRRRTLALARRLFATGNATTDRARAKATLLHLTSSGDGMVAATAGLELARIAATEADFAEAIARCDAAIARVSKQPLRANAGDILLPSLMTESAVAMAARGGLEDADAELAILCRDFPTYPRLSSSLLRVRLVRAMRGGERNAACAIARSRTADLPLPYREDVLADLALVSRGEATEEDLARLAAELHDDGELCAWLDAVAPGLRDDRALVAAGARLGARAISIPPIGPSVRPPAAATEGAVVDAEQADEITSEDAAEKRVVTNG